MSSLQSFNSTFDSYFGKKSRSKEETIDFDFYDSNFNSTGSNGNDSDFEEMDEGVKKIEIKPLKDITLSESFSSDSDKEIGSPLKNVLGKHYESNLTKCIAYENSQFNNSEIGCISKSSSEEETVTPVASPVLDSSLSTSAPSSELTNVTPFSSSSSCSSVKGRNDNYSDDFDDDEDESSKLEMKLLSDAVECMSINKKYTRSPTFSTKSRISNRPRRKNMTFTNEQLRKIDRENEILLKKIMAYTKPRPKQSTLMNNASPPRIKASAAVNRSRQQRQINHDNYILLKKIHNVKSTQSFLNRN